MPDLHHSLKIGLIGVSHWHMPFYMPGLTGHTVVGVCDEQLPLTADSYARRFSCPSYVSSQELLTQAKPDFVLAFAPHSRMKELAMILIQRRIGFSMEKPIGLDASEVAQVATAARQAGVFVSIPLVWRCSQWLRDWKQRLKTEEIIHLSFRFIAGAPDRYLQSSPWMLDRASAGSGCMTNLGPHFLDMALYLTDSQKAHVVGSRFQYASNYNVETYASVLLEFPGGATMSLETGYAFPMEDGVKRENRWNAVTKKGYHTLADGYLEERRFGEPVVRMAVDTDSDVYYASYIRKTLSAYAACLPPAVSIDDMLRVRILLDQILQSSR
ncbi:Gfo/Idh/MocA family oxidoreductase [Diplocloster hominis]|uniref:Gfo/Idh/MocA family protein n=1 Tax=Diplocloster hominis TaxID=3079010 RepID=UPI0031BAA4E1